MPWNWEFLSAVLPVHEIINHANVSFYYLSYNETVTMDTVAAMPDRPWDWGALSWRATTAMVRAHMDKPWDWWVLSHVIHGRDIMANRHWPQAVCDHGPGPFE